MISIQSAYNSEWKHFLEITLNWMITANWYNVTAITLHKSIFHSIVFLRKRVSLNIEVICTLIWTCFITLNITCVNIKWCSVENTFQSLSSSFRFVIRFVKSWKHSLICYSQNQDHYWNSNLVVTFISKIKSS